MDWSAETIEALAPDAASVTAARKLARPAPWSATGCDERALWGLCKGSGSTPYQTQVDLSEPAFKCSCPSRKFPCKHALALMLLRAGGDVAPASAARVGAGMALHPRRAGGASGFAAGAGRTAARPRGRGPARGGALGAGGGGRRGPAHVAARRGPRRARRGAPALVGGMGRVRGAARGRPGAGRGVAAAVAGRRRRGATRRVAGAAAERAGAPAPALRGVRARGRPGARRRARAAGLQCGPRGRPGRAARAATAGSSWRGS